VCVFKKIETFAINLLGLKYEQMNNLDCTVCPQKNATLAQR